MSARRKTKSDSKGNNDKKSHYYCEFVIGHVQLTCGTRFLKLAMMLVLLNSW